jgi:hypothetical protein
VVAVRPTAVALGRPHQLAQQGDIVSVLRSQVIAPVRPELLLNIRQSELVIIGF